MATQHSGSVLEPGGMSDHAVQIAAAALGQLSQQSGAPPPGLGSMAEMLNHVGVLLV